MTQYLLTPDSPGAALAQLLWVVVVLLLYGAAIFRMTRYRLSRTSWRGIRFGLDGSTIAFARLFLGYALLTAVTLGIAYPWLRKAIVGYRLNHARFGRTPFTFEASAGPLLGSWLLFLATLVAAVIVLIAAAERTTGEGTSLQATVDFADFAVLAIPLFAISPVLFIRYRVQEFRLFVASSRLGRAGFASDARATPIVIAAVLTLFAIGLALLALGAMAAAVVTTLPAASGEVDPGALSPMAKILGLIALFFAVFALIPALNYGIFVHSLVRHGCRSMVVHDPAAFEAAARSAVPGPQYGEGIADAFDIGGI